MMRNQETIKNTEKILRQGYSFIAKNDVEEAVIAMTNIIDRYSAGTFTFKMLLEEVTKTIHRVFEFQYVEIAVKELDGKYRYKTSIGLTPEATKSMLQIAYSATDLFDETNYPSTAVSEITRFYMAESTPYSQEEVSTYARPRMLNQARAEPDDMLEGDFIDIYIRGARNDVIGFIEVGVTRNGKLPNKKTIRWLESIARILAIIFSEENA